MKFVRTIITCLSVAASPGTWASMDEVRHVAPALDRYAERWIEEVWNRPQLTPRDRGLVTVAALIAANQHGRLGTQVERALDSGVTPAELSEAITHLAFYAGIGSAVEAAAVVRESFARRGVDVSHLPSAMPDRLPLNELAEHHRAERAQRHFGDVAPQLLQYTADMVFRDLWLRPALAPRDRSLVTVAALIASGEAAHIPLHLGLAMDNGLTQAEAAEVITHLALYVGWPRVFSALPGAKEVFEGRRR